jgi:phthalate 4,5-cis-dihydrodiol dehydrogenase
LRLGVAGLGRAFTLMLRALAADPRIELCAAADPREEARRRFAADFAARTYATVEALCEDRGVDAIYVATPHQHHAAHAIAAMSRGKHVLVEKPMAITLDDCTRMIEAAERAGLVLVVGPSHSFDRPILRAREIIASGEVGAVRMITAQYHTDYLYRPRRPEELVTDAGGGAIYSQCAHQVDVVRLLAGGRATSVRGATGAWDPRRATEGAYAALLTFDGGAFASLAYSGYAHFDGDEWCCGVGEMGMAKRADAYGAARRSLRRSATDRAELALKNARNYGGADPTLSDLDNPADGPQGHPHFGAVIVSCDHADLRPLPNGVMIYGDDEARLDPLPLPAIPRSEVVDEFHGAIVDGRAPLHGGRWAMASLEVCLAILQSSRERREIALRHQVGVEGCAG